MDALNTLGRRPLTIDPLRRYAAMRTLFTPTTLARAIDRLGFVQADPIRAPARAQDLTLRHRVRDYRAGDLELRYPKLGIEEDFFVNYGFLPRDTHALMHPRAALRKWTKARQAQADAVLDFIRARGVAHPREVDAEFQHGKTRNWFGGSSNASTQLLDEMHYRGLLRIIDRRGGVRRYAPRPATPPVEPRAAMDALADVIVRKYAPLPERSLTQLMSLLRRGAPQWAADERRDALLRAKARWPSAEVDGVRWFWPEGESPVAARWRIREEARLLAPFDPIVWDRRRFELLWGWSYRFEAYTPAAKRQRGYYALPLLWRDAVIGWGNLSLAAGRLNVSLGYAAGAPPNERAFDRALEEEVERMRAFLSPR